MNTSTRPSLETIAGLYAAAAAQQDAADRAMQNVITSGKRHGYSEEEIMAAAVHFALHTTDTESPAVA